jgi:hypothetical protein
VKPALTREEPDVQDSQQVQAKDDDHDAADATDPVAMTKQRLAEYRRGRTHREEDQREAKHEQNAVDKRRAARVLYVVDRQARDERDVARNQRQHAGRKERQQARAERDQDADARGFHVS